MTTFTDTVPTTITATATTSLVGFLLLLQSSTGDYNDENHKSSVFRADVKADYLRLKAWEENNRFRDSCFASSDWRSHSRSPATL